MKITILQIDIKWAQPSANAIEAEHLIASAPASDLYVLPEMWSTGFATEPQGIAEDEEMPESLKWMICMAQKYDAAICGSIAVMDNKCGANRQLARNRHYFVKPDGTYQTYDKHHLFKYGGEDKFYLSGNERTVAEWRGFRFLLLVCYDLRFPKWIRYQDDYDAIIVVANWPESRQNVWQTLTKARAIENLCYLIGCNRVGDDKYCHYVGQSAIIDPKGYVITESQEPTPEAITAEISIDELRKFRDKFPVLQDRD
jgi:predicted amidohydrolase